MKRLLIAGLIISSSALSCENSNPSPWGEIAGAFAGAWAGNQLGGSGLWTIAGAVAGGAAGGYLEDQIMCQPAQQPSLHHGVYDPKTQQTEMKLKKLDN